MNKIIETELKPIKLWLEDIEEGALVQAKNLANLPFIFNSELRKFSIRIRVHNLHQMNSQEF